jgi:xylulokinase
VILAIDCGSTNLKAALFDEQLKRLGEASVPMTYTVRDAERAEFDVETFWQNVVALIQKLRPPGPIESVTLTSQAQTFTVAGPESRSRMPFISWMDRRAVQEATEFQTKLGTEFHRHCSFASPVPELFSCKLLWVKRSLPGVLTPDAQIVSLPEFVALRLTGVRAVDRNLAAMSGLYSLARGDWWDEALEICGVARSQLGALVNVGEVVTGRCAHRELPVAANLKVGFAGNDQTSGAFGVLGRADGLVLTLGTALVVYRYAGAKPGPFSPGGCWGPYPGGGYYELATRNEGCDALDWAAGELLPGRDVRAFMQLAESGPSGAALFFPQRIRTDKAWSGDASPAERARAVVEGISFTARQLIVEDLRVEMQDKLLLVIGGGSKSDFWLQMLADVLNCPLRRGAGDNLLGSTLMLQAADSVRRDVGRGSTFHPDPQRASQCAALFERWTNHATSTT